MLTTTHKREFFERGYTRIVGAIEAEALAKFSDDLWHRLGEYGIERSRPESWRTQKPRGLQTTSKNAQFNSVFGDVTRSCLDTLLGEGQWESPKHWGQLLLSTPVNTRWEVPSKAWHLDLPDKNLKLECPGVQIFVCVEDIVGKCGATLAAIGSHKLVTASLQTLGLPTQAASATLRERIAKDCDWLRQLTSNEQSEHRNEYFMDRVHRYRGASLCVEELTGSRGDLILMHPFLFHAPAPSIGPAMRIALTQRIYSN